MKITDVLADGMPARFVERMPFDVYRSSPAINMSTAVHMAQSPFHFHSAWNGEDEDSDQKQYGRAVHIAAFQPDEFEDRVKEADGVRTPKKKAEARAAGIELLKPNHAQYGYWCAVESAKRLSELEELRPFIASGQAELSGFTVEEGMACKFRLDWLRSEPCIIDLKTTRSLDPFAFSRDFYRLHYDKKLGMYQYWTARLLGGKPADVPVYLLVQENHAPYDCFLAPRYNGKAIPIDQAVLDRGARIGLEWLKRIRACIDSGEWPGIAGVADAWALHTPSWEMDDGDADNLSWS